MKFVKGIILGTIVSAGVAMICADNSINKRKMMKKGRKIAKKIGMI